VELALRWPASNPTHRGLLGVTVRWVRDGHDSITFKVLTIKNGASVPGRGLIDQTGN